MEPKRKKFRALATVIGIIGVVSSLLGIVSFVSGKADLRAWTSGDLKPSEPPASVRPKADLAERDGAYWETVSDPGHSRTFIEQVEEWRRSSTSIVPIARQLHATDKSERSAAVEKLVAYLEANPNDDFETYVAGHALGQAMPEYPQYWQRLGEIFEKTEPDRDEHLFLLFQACGRAARDHSEIIVRRFATYQERKLQDGYWKFGRTFAQTGLTDHAFLSLLPFFKRANQVQNETLPLIFALKRDVLEGLVKGLDVQDNFSAITSLANADIDIADGPYADLLVGIAKKFGPSAYPLTPQLLRCKSSWFLRKDLDEAFRAIGPAAAPAFNDAIRGGNREAVSLLRNIGPVEPALQRFILERCTADQWRTWASLVELRPTLSEVTDGLQAALRMEYDGYAKNGYKDWSSEKIAGDMIEAAGKLPPSRSECDGMLIEFLRTNFSRGSRDRWVLAVTLEALAHRTPFLHDLERAELSTICRSLIERVYPDFLAKAYNVESDPGPTNAALLCLFALGSPDTELGHKAAYIALRNQRYDRSLPIDDIARWTTPEMIRPLLSDYFEGSHGRSVDFRAEGLSDLVKFRPSLWTYELCGYLFGSHHLDAIVEISNITKVPWILIDCVIVAVPLIWIDRGVRRRLQPDVAASKGRRMLRWMYVIPSTAWWVACGLCVVSGLFGFYG